jgi:NAD(P)-dependent dehydrogenase (short-subunit alcohol dehydrogenase family)
MTRKVAFITGASRGIGKASALALAKKGYDIVVTARTVREGERYDYGSTAADVKEMALPGSIELTAEEVRKLGRDALPIRLDLLDLPSIDAAVDRAIAEWGQIDLLLNNGIYQGPGTMEAFLDIPLDALQKIFEGNVFAQLHITQLAVRHMLERGGGTIINMTSGSALMDPPAPTGQGGWGFAYGASKGAFTRMVGILNVEFGPRGIRAFNLNPGYVETESQKQRLEGEDNPFLAHFKGAPPEVPAAVIAWLASEREADEMVGEVVDAMRFCAKRQLVPGWPPPKQSPAKL